MMAAFTKEVYVVSSIVFIFSDVLDEERYAPFSLAFTDKVSVCQFDSLAELA
jgi:hypothetical protein